jgi:hypothetical protein
MRLRVPLPPPPQIIRCLFFSSSLSPFSRLPFSFVFLFLSFHQKVNRATLGLREAELLVSAESVGLSLAGRAVQRVQGLLEVAERAVGQQQKRQEERVRFAYAREEVSAHRRLRRDYRDKLKFRAEQGNKMAILYYIGGCEWQRGWEMRGVKISGLCLKRVYAYPCNFCLACPLVSLSHFPLRIISPSS